MRKWLPGGAVLLILLASCGSSEYSAGVAAPSDPDSSGSGVESGTTPVASTESEPLPAIPTPSSVTPFAEDWAPVGINAVVHWAEVGIVGTVRNVRRVDAGSTGVGVDMVRLEVDEILFSSLQIDELATIDYVQLRPDDRSGDSIAGLPSEVPIVRRYGPELEVGQGVIVLLAQAQVYGFSELQLHPAHGYLSTWVVDDGIAISVDPLRSVAADLLLDRILQERASPLLTPDDEPAFTADQTTTRNPLGAETGPPTSSTTPATPTTAVTSRVPQLIDAETAFELRLEAPEAELVARMGAADTGGVVVKVYDSTQQIAGMGAPDVTGLVGKWTTTLLPDGRIALSAIGDRELNPDDVAVAVDGVPHDGFSTGLWASQGGYLAILLVVPAGSRAVSIAGFLAGGGELSIPIPPQLDTPLSTNVAP